MPMGSGDIFAPVGNHTPIEGRASQVPQWRPAFETPRTQQQREIRTAVSPKKSFDNGRSLDRSPWSSEIPQGNVSRSTPSCETPPARRYEGYRSQDTLSAANTSKTWNENRKQSPITPPGNRAPRSTNGAVLQALGNGQILYSTSISLVDEDESPLRTPGSHRLKRKGSDLTPSSEAGVLRSGGSVASSTELCRLDLRSPPRFNRNIHPEQMSPSAAKARRTERYNLQTPLSIDLQPGYNDANLPRSSESTSIQDPKGSPSHSNRPTVRKLAPYTKRPPNSLAPEMLICETIIKPLTKPEMGIAWTKSSSGIWTQQKSHEGWIYIYQLSNEVNTVKIGITQVSIEGRLDSWTEQCGHKPQVLYPSTASEREPVPHIYRLEALVQAELAAHRLEEVGCPCGKTHIEWFEESLANARKVVIKWSEWMRRNPYEMVEPKHWHLSPQYIPDLAELSRPSLMDGSAVNPVWV